MRTFTLSHGDSLVINNCVLLRAAYIMGLGSNMILRGAHATLRTGSGAYRHVLNGEEFPFFDGETLRIPIPDGLCISVFARYSVECPTHIDLVVDAPIDTPIQMGTPITDTPNAASEPAAKPVNWFKILAGLVGFILATAAFAYFDGWLSALVFVFFTLLFLTGH